MFQKQRQNPVVPRLTVKTAVVCVQCETLYQGPGECPSCGSGAGQPLSRWVPSMAAMPKVRRICADPREVA